MRRRTGVIWGFAGAQLLAATIAYAVTDWQSTDWIDLAGQVVVICQFNLAGIWVAMGHRISPWRLLAVGIILTCLTWGSGDVVGDLHSIMFILIPSIFITLGALFLARMCGFCLHDFESIHTDNVSKLQFSLRSILIWTAVTAMLLSLASLVNPEFAQLPASFNWQDLLYIVPLLLLFTGTCLAELVVILAMRRPWLGHVVCVPIVLSLFGLFGWFQDEVEVFVGVGTCTVVWFALCFWPLRLLGWRFGRPKPMDGDNPPENEASLLEQRVSRFTIANAMRRWKIWHRHMRNLPTSRRAAILWVLAVGQFLIAAVAFATAFRMPNEWFLYVCFGLHYSQPYLAGVWIASGRRSLPWRFVVVAALLTSLSFLPGMSTPSLQESIVVLSPGIIAALVLMLAARTLGLRVYHEVAERPREDSRWLQFSLRSAFEWTAATAMVCSLAALAGPRVSSAFQGISGKIPVILIVHVPFAAVCVAELMVLLGMRRPWIGLLILFPIALAVGGLIGWVTEALEVILVVMTWLVLWFAICFTPLRLFGYRFGRHSRKDLDPDPLGEPPECPFQEPPDLAD